MRAFTLQILVFVLVLPSACASLDSTDDLNASRDAIARQLGTAPTWSSAPDVSPWLGGSLSADDAVSFALERNPALRRDVASISAARAAVAQADTPPNPMVSLWVGLPLTGAGGTAITAAAMQQIAWLWQKPSRVATEEARLRANVLSAADRAVKLAAEVRADHVTVLAAEEALDAAKIAEVAANAAARAVEGRVRAGDFPRSSLFLMAERSSLARREVASAEGALVAARVRLLESIGLAESTCEWTTDHVWPPDSQGLRADRTTVADAVERRLDVAAADALVVAAESECRSAGASRIPSVALGAEYERMSSGEQSLGPAMNIEVPLFDRGDARVATALAKLDDAQWAARAARQNAATELTRARGELAATASAWRDGSDAARRIAEARRTSLTAAVAAGIASEHELHDATLALADRTLESIEDRRAAAVAAISLNRALAGGRR
ncbi:MAG: TolC family protein [Phycisphaerae bacterium]|nr:TolC family protein [Phycisphaerae bacterium]